jgi:ketosteroid isomerase-like protein
MEQDNRELLRLVFEAFNGGDDDALVAMWHEDAELYGFPGVPDAPDVYRGRDGLRGWLANLRRTFEDVRFEPKDVTLKDDVGVIEVAASAKGAGSGVPIEWTAFLVVRVRDGKVARIQAFVDREEAFAAAGFVE